MGSLRCLLRCYRAPLRCYTRPFRDLTGKDRNSSEAASARISALCSGRRKPAGIYIPSHSARLFFGLVFGAVTVYVGLRAGLTVAASIPIAVLSISILRAFGRASILENNIVQTTGNAGQSIASGVIFTLPALVFLGFDLEYSRIFMLALIGGWLGVLFMIPLRRQLIVEEHGMLPYPEGTACADVLMAGEQGGSLASRVFLGLGLGRLYTLFQNDNLFGAWPGTPEFAAGFWIPTCPERRVDQRGRDVGVSGRGLHHRPARCGSHLCRRRFVVAGDHAADLLLRQESAPTDLSGPRSYCSRWGRATCGRPTSSRWARERLRPPD